jgi:hypothetical protein
MKPVKGPEGELDTVFSIFIKLRDDWTCRRCGIRTVPGNKYYDPAHIIKRGNHMVRWDERNVFGMDRVCHNFIDDHPAAREAWYITVFGQAAWDELCRKARILSHFRDWEIEEKIEYYKGKIKELKHGKR